MMSAAQNLDLGAWGGAGRKPFIGLYFMLQISLAAVNNQAKLYPQPAEAIF